MAFLFYYMFKITKNYDIYPATDMPFCPVIIVRFSVFFWAIKHRNLFIELNPRNKYLVIYCMDVEQIRVFDDTLPSVR